ncbi:hypothetical protein Tco_0179526 [Tanacetum coccineum]
MLLLKIPTNYGSVIQGEGSTHPVGSHHTPTSAPSTLQPPISSTYRRTTRQESVVPQPRSPTQTLVADETDHKERGDSVERVATTTTSLDAEQGSVNTLGSGKDSMTLQELMVYSTTLSNKVESLETDLKRKIAAIDQDLGISLVQHDAEIRGRYGHDMEFDFDFDAAKEVSTTEKDVSTTEPVSTVGAGVTTVSVAVSTASPTRNIEVSTADDITIAETLVYIRKSAAKDKAAVRLQDELEEEERQRIARVHEAASSFNVEEWEDIQARVEADEELAQRLQAEEKEMYTKVEQERMLIELINQRERYFAAQIAEESRNNPPTQAQQRTYMSNYIKHMGSHTLQQLRGYSFDEIKTLFETTMRGVNTFVPIESEVDRAVPELAAGSSKRDAEEELDQKSSKRQKTGKSSKLAKEPKDKDEELS